MAARGSASQLPSSQRTGAVTRESPAGPRPGGRAATGVGDRPSQRPNSKDLGNFLGVGATAAGLGGDARIAQGAAAERRSLRPEQRPGWSERSQNRSRDWRQRVDHRNEAWEQRERRREGDRNDFQQNRDERWNRLESARDDRQNWRDQNREDWQQHREELWSYRADRAEEIWDHTRDFYDDLFDDRWWGAWGWGGAWVGTYAANPWWWWAPAVFGTAAAFVDCDATEPSYVDYGMTVIYEGDTVYVDNQPVPAADYMEPVIDLAGNVEQPPPPLPPAAPPSAAGMQPVQDWLPLGVFALAQEEKGDPVMFFQLSVNRQGVISGGYTGTITNDQRPVAGRVDRATQRAAWRIGENADTIFETSLANLTLDLSPVAVHFGKRGTQTWLLVRMPEPAQAGQAQSLPEARQSPPPLKSAMAN